MTTFAVILIALNALAFAVAFFARGDRRGMVNGILSAIGGAGGVLLAHLLTRRHPEKEDMLSRVVTGSACVIWLSACLVLFCGKEADLRVWRLFARFPVILIFFIALNILTFFLFFSDKHRAVRGRYRIPIAVLLTSCLFFGSLGGLIGMYTFRHKTQTLHFTLGVPLLLASNLAFLVAMTSLIW